MPIRVLGIWLQAFRARVRTKDGGAVLVWNVFAHEPGSSPFVDPLANVDAAICVRRRVAWTP